MDMKKVYSTSNYQSNPIRGSNLNNPLISISKASTPIRKRIIKEAQPMNSTPVNVHKIGNKIRSPALSNKQNNQGGNSKVQIKVTKIPEKLNLSPILALNRKMSSGPRLEQKCLTPNGLKREESLSALLDQNSEQLTQNHNQYGNLPQNRNSNFFKNMLEIRSKTPTRKGLSECQQSLGSNFFGAFKGGNTLNNTTQMKLKQSKSGNLMTSDSFDSFRSTGSQLRQNQIACINEHEKKTKAKYKVIEQSDNDDDQMLVYCSRCAILLVKKGFKVEELTQEDILKMKMKKQDEKNSLRESNKYCDYADQTMKRLKIRLDQILEKKQVMFSIHSKAIDDVNCYYDSIIALIEEQRMKDKQKINEIRQQDRNEGQILQIKVMQAINQLENMMKYRRAGNKELPIIQNLESLMVQKCTYTHRLNNSPLADNIQQKFNEFSEAFQEQFKLFFQKQQNFCYEKLAKNPSKLEKKAETDCALRFSFEKSLSNQDYNRKGRVFGAHINAISSKIQEVEEESGDLSNQNDKKAFRTLFPEDPESDPDEQKQKVGIHSPTFKQF